MTDVIMPQMGESIAEGTITKWMKNVGDKVERDEPLFEISTDKVDAEIPAPAAGVLKEIRVEAGHDGGDQHRRRGHRGRGRSRRGRGPGAAPPRPSAPAPLARAARAPAPSRPRPWP